MPKNKPIIYIIILIILAALAAYWLLFKNNFNTNSEDEWNDINYIFNVSVPDDFDEYKIERLNEKIEDSKNAYQEKPTDSWTWDMIGNMYEFVRDYDRALAAYYRALEFEPQDITAVLNVATIHENYVIDYSESEKYYSQAISIFPQIPDNYDRLALLYWRKMDRLDDAEAIYLQGLDQTNNHLDVLLDLINFYVRTDQEDKAKFYAEQLLKNYPDNPTYERDYGYLVE